MDSISRSIMYMHIINDVEKKPRAEEPAPSGVCLAVKLKLTKKVETTRNVNLWNNFSLDHRNGRILRFL